MKEKLLADLSEDDRVIVEYGLKQGAILFAGVILAMVVGILLNIPGKALIFLGCSYVLRIYAGGYHAKTQSTCNIFSFIGTLLCFLWLKYIFLPLSLLHVSTIISSLFIGIFAPIGNENKLLDELERKIYGRRAKYIVSVECILYFIAFVLNLKYIYYCINLSLIFVALLMGVGMISQYRNGREENENINM